MLNRIKHTCSSIYLSHLSFIKKLKLFLNPRLIFLFGSYQRTIYVTSSNGSLYCSRCVTSDESLIVLCLIQIPRRNIFAASSGSFTYNNLDLLLKIDRNQSNIFRNCTLYLFLEEIFSMESFLYSYKFNQ